MVFGESLELYLFADISISNFKFELGLDCSLMLIQVYVFWFTVYIQSLFLNCLGINFTAQKTDF